jgi:(p)ppGpp synthase/HD superfamily hydrolase
MTTSIPTGPALATAAFAFAEQRHAATGKLRKGTDLPYFVHPSAVGATLGALYPGNFELMAAGFCHDLIEDTPTTRDELETLFGPTVASLVAAVSSPRGRDWSHTRALALEQLKASSDDAVRVKAADSLDNAGSTVRDVREQGLESLKVEAADPEAAAEIAGFRASRGHSRSTPRETIAVTAIEAPPRSPASREPRG